MAAEEEGDMYHPTSNRLVDILREENASLKQELEAYYQRVRKLQKVSAQNNSNRYWCHRHKCIQLETFQLEGWPLVVMCSFHC